MNSGPAGTRVPGATYRLQFNAGFTFAQAKEISGYLRDLGVTDVYASPLFKAGPDSTHGYDICGFGELNPALGGEQGFNDLTSVLRRLDMALLLDMVPNHMGNDLSNAWWNDVLERGPNSPYARWFDIDWHRHEDRLQGKILLPVLEDHYSKVLEAGKLKLSLEGSKLSVTYYDRKFPVSSRSYAFFVRRILHACQAADGAESAAADAAEFLRELENPDGSDSAPALEALRNQVLKWYSGFPEFRVCIDHTLAELNGSSDKPESFDGLHEFLGLQQYRLAYWRVGPEEINYRRFFDVTQLVSMRMEDPEVYQKSHELVFQLIRDGRVTGLRIDHPDGLWNPREYFERLQTNRGGDSRPIYVVAEKILTGDEVLPGSWLVHGTTGYDYLNRLNGLFVNTAKAEEATANYERFTGLAFDFASIAYRNKKTILEKSLISELRALTRKLRNIARATRYGQDLPDRQLREALVSVIAAFPVYRTYLEETSQAATESEAHQIGEAVCIAGQREPGLDENALRFIRDILLLQFPADLDAAQREKAREFVMRFQQLSGPVMAKGLEDTSFYQYYRLVSLNEVGGEPEKFGHTVDEYHEFNSRQLRRFPHTLLATATHDTKRGEDTRARVNVLSEMPGEWFAAASRWSDMNHRHKANAAQTEIPDRNDEYLLYQTLVGAWTQGDDAAERAGSFKDRVTEYMMKALKEGKRHTTWTEPNEAYEKGTADFVAKILADPGFLRDFAAFQKRIAFFGVFNSLSQTLLKLTSPGVPDIYQGTELWDFSMVDPDNRRPVDYVLRQRYLKHLQESGADSSAARTMAKSLLSTPEDGRIKLWTLWKGLSVRQQHRLTFDKGGYVPLDITGSAREHVCAFARVYGEDVVITVAPRLVFTLLEGQMHPPTGEKVWKDTSIDLAPLRQWIGGRPFTNAFSGEDCSTDGDFKPAQILQTFPVALLHFPKS